MDNLDTCDLTNCVGDPPDFEACGCVTCVMPWIGCLVDCTPECLDTVVIEFINWLTEEENDCYNKCSEYQGGVETIGIPLFTQPTNYDLSSLLEDWRDCLPTFPACGSMHDTVTDTTCDATACYSICHGEKLVIENCFYNWISGQNCVFMCSEQRSLTRKVPRKLGANSADPEFVQGCKLKVASDLLLYLDIAFNNYFECIMSNSMELAADESNRPTTESSDGSGRLMMAFPISIAALMFDLIR